MVNALQSKYEKKIKPELKKQFKFSSVMQIPRIEKIVINMTAGKDVTDSKAIAQVDVDLAKITGQKPKRTIAKKSLASFKLREGMPMGGMVTLRRKKMWDFLQKLIEIILPRVRDFRGVKTSSFDIHGNYALGIKEHIIFPEIDFDKVEKIRGLDVIIVMSSKNKEQNKAMLDLLGLPFRKGGN